MMIKKSVCGQCFLFQPTRRCLVPHLPQLLVDPIDTMSQRYQKAKHSAALLTKEAFVQRLYTFSRSNFDVSQSEAAHIQLQELLLNRLSHVSPKVLHEHMHLAYVAGFYKVAIDLFYKSIQHESQIFMLSEYVVDSAYALQSSTDLIQMASYCATKCTAGRNREYRDLLAEFSLLRIFWRTTCLYEKASLEESKGVYGKDGSNRYATDCEAIFKFIGDSFPKESSVSNLFFFVFFRLTQRLIKYDVSGDDGEMMFYRECVARNILLIPGESTLNKCESPNTHVPAKGIPILASEITEVELFYATLIGTCITGRHVSAATSYYQQISEMVTSGSSWITAAHKISEFVVYKLLSVLQANKENLSITHLARSLIAEGNSISISVWSIILVSAGEMRAGDVALHAYQSALEQLESSSGSTDRRGLEYLLQTALNALSKCQIPSFEEKYLQACRNAGLLHCTDEFYLCCLLQEAHNSMNPMERAGEVRDRIEAERIPLTARLISRFLKIYLRAEVDDYFSLYHHAVVDLGIFRRPWIDGLLLWADRRRYAMTQHQRKFIISEVLKRLGPTAKEHLGGLRTQFALLQYDYSVQPCTHFLQNAVPPTEEPTVQDPRVHFLVRRPSNTSRGVLGTPRFQRGIEKTSLHNTNQEQVPETREAKCGALQRKDIVSRVAFLSSAAVAIPSCTEEAEVEAFRVFLSDVLGSLQQSKNFVD